MGGEALYERYKDALKRGHVASLRGRLDEALDAYAEASSIAPERPTPHASAGIALLRRRRPADALRYYEAALSIAPRDEASLLGRAQALAAMDRRPEAADAFDALADQRASAGKLADAVDAARRGLELAEGRDRRRTLTRLMDRLRASEPGEPGRLALERALRVLEGTAVAIPPRTAPATRTPGEADHEPGSKQPGGPDTVATDAATTEPGAPDGPDRTDAAAELAEPEAGPEAGPPVHVRSALDRDVPPGADLAQLTRRAEAALDAGDVAGAVDGLLDLAAVNRGRGHAAAAMDACYLALSVEPDNVGLHLALVQLYDDSGWTGLATEKLDLLGRLVSLGDDPDGTVRVAAMRSGRG